MGTGSGVISHEFVTPWHPKEAQARIRAIANGNFDYMWTDAVKKQLADCKLINGDVLHVCKKGEVNEPGQNSTQPRVCRYTMESPSPNSEGKVVRVNVAVTHANEGKKDCLKVVEVSIC